MVPEEGEVEALGRNVGVATSLCGNRQSLERSTRVRHGWNRELTRVVQALVLAIQGLNICGNNLVLVRWAREVVAETTSGSVETVGLSVISKARLTECCNFGLELLGSSDGGDVWA